MGQEGRLEESLRQSNAAGINTGGKTGTAQKVVPLYDPKTGEPKTRHRVEKDNRGNIIREYDEVIMDNEHPRIDAWFLVYRTRSRNRRLR